jgi:hypothetical protein
MQTKAHVQWAFVALPSQQQPSPNAGGASHCVYRTREFDEHRVAHRLEQAAIAFGNLGVDQVAAVGKQLSRAVLIGLHQTRIADYVSDQYRRHSPFHRSRPPRRRLVYSFLQSEPSEVRATGGYRTSWI